MEKRTFGGTDFESGWWRPEKSHTKLNWVEQKKSMDSIRGGVVVLTSCVQFLQQSPILRMALATTWEGSELHQKHFGCGRSHMDLPEMELTTSRWQSPCSNMGFSVFHLWKPLELILVVPFYLGVPPCNLRLWWPHSDGCDAIFNEDNNALLSLNLKEFSLITKGKLLANECWLWKLHFHSAKFTQSSGLQSLVNNEYCWMAS